MPPTCAGPQRGPVLIILFIVCVYSHAQIIPGAAVLTLADTGAYSIVERSDWRRYDNGRYIGLVRNEVRAFILPGAAAGKAYHDKRARHRRLILSFFPSSCP